MKYKPVTAAALASRFVRPGDAVLEIGAADGMYTSVYAQSVGRTGCVLAVEPHDAHLRTLRSLAKVLPWVKVWPGVVGATWGDAVFYPDETNAKHSSIHLGNVADPGEPYAVPMTTIDRLVAFMPQPPALIHVDAQGAEAEILAGALETLKLPIVWVIELWASGLARAGSSVHLVMNTFYERAYHPRSVLGADLEWVAAADEIGNRRGAAHADVVMVPAPFAEVRW